MNRKKISDIILGVSLGTLFMAIFPLLIIFAFISCVYYDLIKKFNLKNFFKYFFSYFYFISKAIKLYYCFDLDSLNRLEVEMRDYFAAYYNDANYQNDSGLNLQEKVANYNWKEIGF